MVRVPTVPDSAVVPARPDTMAAPTAVRLASGVTALAAATVIAIGAAEVVGWLNSAIVALAIGAAIANLAPILAGHRAFALADRVLFRVGVVLLGLELSLPDLRSVGAPMLVAVVFVVFGTFAVATWLARRTGMTPAAGVLMGAGFGVCGVAAIAAVEAVAEPDERDVATAVAAVTLSGTVALFVLPVLAELFGLGAKATGAWLGAAIQDVGQVVAASSGADDVLMRTAIITKLARVALLAPVVLLAARLRSAADHRHARRLRPPLIVVGFAIACALASTGLVPGAIVDTADPVRTVLITTGLVGVGARVDMRRLRGFTGRPLAVAAGTWATVTALALLGALLAAG